MEVFVGSIVAFGFNFPPYGWASCNGQLISIAENSTLYALLGTTYGGNGQTTFGLPNLQGRSPVGQGNLLGTSFPMGQTAGNASITLTSANMPMHNHVGTNPVSIPVYNAAGNSSDPTGNRLAVATGVNLYTNSATDAGMRPFNIPNITVSMSGGNQPLDIMDPYLAINYSIALYGIFPSRN